MHNTRRKGKLKTGADGDSTVKETVQHSSKNWNEKQKILAKKAKKGKPVAQKE